MESVLERTLEQNKGSGTKTETKIETINNKKVPELELDLLKLIELEQH